MTPTTIKADVRTLYDLMLRHQHSPMWAAVYSGAVLRYVREGGCPDWLWGGRLMSVVTIHRESKRRLEEGR